MVITATQIKELRERTGAGMMDCKKALTETGGDLDRAIEELRKKGVAAAQKKAGRIAAEGVIVSARNAQASVLVEVNCETDFVAKDASFQAFCSQVAAAALDSSPADVQALGGCVLDNGETAETVRQKLIAKVGENISVRRFARMEAGDGTVSSYLHGSRIGVLVKLVNGSAELGRDLAMHVAASRPLCISEEAMDRAVLDREQAIYVAQAEESGKPPAIVEKMVQGRVKKFLRENTLMHQPFVKNTDQSVGGLLAEAGASVVDMVRFEAGEGIEKRSDDFVSEVMARAGA
ncbi:MAG: translation elongation factor Ts [Gammaproteobacteria bacterium]|nr:translation elongation factor Ts [Gammaproteobacteria bacterium]